jgi:hypothetical protein
VTDYLAAEGADGDVLDPEHALEAPGEANAAVVETLVADFLAHLVVDDIDEALIVGGSETGTQLVILSRAGPAALLG